MKRLVTLILFSFWSTAALAQAQTVPIKMPENPNISADLNTPLIAPMLDEDDLDFGENVDAFGKAVNLDAQPPMPASKQLETPQAENRDTPINVDTRQSLTDNLKKNAPQDMPDLEVPEVNRTWVNQLISSAKDNVKKAGDKNNPLSDMLEQSKQQNQRSNASIFDISGVMLRMSYKQAEETLSKRGYKKTMQKMDIPNFIRWRNEETCRNQGVIGYERLNNCVIKIAQKEQYQFVSQAQFSKYDTKETIQISLTSTFTNNKIYKITYRTEASNVTGNSPKSVYLRNIKIYDFWKKINQKYGAPDNKDDVIWSLGGNKPYMKAATGFLVLEDPMLRELDYTRMSREDQRFLNTDLYTF